MWLVVTILDREVMYHQNTQSKNREVKIEVEKSRFLIGDFNVSLLLTDKVSRKTKP